MWPFPKKEARGGTKFTDLDRENSAAERENRAMSKRIDLLEQKLELDERLKEIEEYAANLGQSQEGDAQGDDMDSMMKNIAMKVLLSKFAAGTSPASTTPQTTTQMVGDDSIREMLKTIPQIALPALRAMKDEELLALVKSKMPGIDDATASRAISIFRTEKY